VPEVVRSLLAQAWQELLFVTPDEDSDFFADGGHSLAAAEIAAIVGDRLGTEIDAFLFFQHPRFGELAEALEVSQAMPAPAVLAGRAIPLSPSQRPVLNKRAAQRAQGEPVSPFTLPGIGIVFDRPNRPQLARVQDAAADLLMEFPALRARIDLHQGRVEIVPIDSTTQPAIRQHRTADELHATTVRDAAAALEASPFEADEIPRIRVALVESPSRTTVVLLVDHLIADDTALRILVERFTDLLTGAPPDPSSATVQEAGWRAFASEQQHIACGDPRVEPAVQFWRSHLGPIVVPTTRLLGTDRFQARPCDDYRGATKTLAEGWVRLSHAASSARATPFAVILVGVWLLCQERTGAPEYLVTPVENRRSGCQHLVAFCSHSVVRRAPDQVHDVADAVKQAMAWAAEIGPHSFLPHAALIQRLSPDEYGKVRSAPWIHLNVFLDEWRAGAVERGGAVDRSGAHLQTLDSTWWNNTLLGIEVRRSGADLRLTLSAGASITTAAQLTTLLDELCDHLGEVIDALG